MVIRSIGYGCYWCYRNNRLFYNFYELFLGANTSNSSNTSYNVDFIWEFCNRSDPVLRVLPVTTKTKRHGTTQCRAYP